MLVAPGCGDTVPLLHDFLTHRDALVADVYAGTGNHDAHLILRFAAEGAAGDPLFVFIVTGHEDDPSFLVSKLIGW
jgi:hypothetical protein